MKFDLQAMGTKGVLTISRSRFVITPETIKGQPAMEAMEVKGNNLDDAHMRNFLDCVKSRNRPNADIEEGHRSAVMCHLGNIATRLNRTVQWDAAKQEVAAIPLVWGVAEVSESRMGMTGQSRVAMRRSGWSTDAGASPD